MSEEHLIPVRIHTYAIYGTLEKLNNDLAELIARRDSIASETIGNGLLHDIEIVKNMIRTPDPTICGGCGKPIGHSNSMGITYPIFDGHRSYVHMIDSLGGVRESIIDRNPCIQAWATKHGLKAE
jgi:hypothetical protein